MRKFILVAALATVWSSSCHANLSLASNATLPPAVAEAKATDVEAPKARAPEPRRSTAERTPSSPRRYFSSRPPIIRTFYQHCL